MAITTNNNNEIGGKITQALGAGSGVDIHNLATTLAETETMPRINSVTEKRPKALLRFQAMVFLSPVFLH